ncbi:hypothetical protein ACFPVT_08645 [Corynebacterium choanae]|uniref:Uncharacterized protein n=1 Tax=Corynebacterium choanae TaxID=1862358 RepID=A0A3G6J8W4_9CORY|nr:hypothetical protein [Corynebacterium choanae]AZA13328.1 hypothetical protein CCHOA_04600 [Corynebacterium choanae]
MSQTPQLCDVLTKLVTTGNTMVQRTLGMWLTVGQAAKSFAIK